jgi:hypothetical protein
VRSRDPYVAWIVASVVAGTLVAFINIAGSPVLSVTILALAPALILSPIVAMFDGNPVLWIVTTLLGVGIAVVTTYVTFVVLFVGLSAVLPTLWPGATSAPLWTLPVVAALACFVGAVPLGVLQRYALPAVRRSWSFPLAVMIGAAALSPVVLAIVSAPVDRTPLLGTLGGLGYGLATAVALGRGHLRNAQSSSAVLQR